MFTEEQKNELDKPLSRSAVKQREQGNSKLSYVEAWHVIAEANRIFGFDGWDRETIETKMVVERPRKIGRGQYEKDGWGVTYTAKVRVTVDGKFREGTGAGHGIDADLGLAHESAIKEAESDAMKRAFMTFGNPFGLALYDKTQENVADDSNTPVDKPQHNNHTQQAAKPKSKAEARPLYQALETDMRRNKTTQDLKAWWTDSECKEKRSALPESWKQNLHDAFVDYGYELNARKQKEDAEREAFPGSMSDQEAMKHPLNA